MSASLAELQHALARHVLGEAVPELRERASAPAGCDLDARLAVYAEGYPARLGEALREAYPALEKILGQSGFSALAQRYRPHAPMGWCNLNDVGRGLPEWLIDDPLALELPFLPDLARLEWAVLESFGAAQRSPFDARACAAWDSEDWARARIGFQPGTTLLSSRWPIHTLREARHLDRESIDIEVHGHPQCVLVHRSGFDVVAREAAAAEAIALERLLGGSTLGEVMAELAAQGAEPQAVVALFADWAEHGLVVSCSGAPIERAG